MNKQRRIDFPDYPAEQQEKDFERSQRLKKKDVYIMKIRGIWNAYLPRPKCPLSISGERGQNLTDFIGDMKQEFEEELKIKPNFHCILNKGVEDYLIQQIEVQKLLKGEGR